MPRRRRTEQSACNPFMKPEQLTLDAQMIDFFYGSYCRLMEEFCNYMVNSGTRDCSLQEYYKEFRLDWIFAMTEQGDRETMERMKKVGIIDKATFEQREKDGLIYERES